MFSGDPRTLITGGCWLVFGICAVSAVPGALEHRNAALRAVLLGALLIGWGAAFAALAIAATSTLTVARMIVPAGPLVALAAIVAGDRLVLASIALGASAIAATLLLTAEVGAVFVQGSAYGAEVRAALRPPLSSMVATIVLWLGGGTLLTFGLLGLDRSWWPVAIVMAGLGSVVLVLLARAVHQLSRRWLVLVPAGVVIHDPLVLADTVMLPRRVIAEVGLSMADTDPLDCTGGATGSLIGITLTEQLDVNLAGRPGRPGARHLTADGLLVAPTRPGRFLALAEAHRLKVSGGR